jgi:hypothetical protein
MIGRNIYFATRIRMTNATNPKTALKPNQCSQGKKGCLGTNGSISKRNRRNVQIVINCHVLTIAPLNDYVQNEQQT